MGRFRMHLGGHRPDLLMEEMWVMREKWESAMVSEFQFE